ncbi:MCE family protein [Amycolatopsis acidiphila]|uniref:MCE family protein n=1 Tax=Amycolatopsis acidiphila TaxID=715473 RepID=A0A558AHX5_9PSEU|nr:MlaD family protein [Amycolatopsis acidiphila]TVT23865.1 MCE family protein [Amycolatopsis acidiphila]UIJ61160.1 MCE family protein [Amycolatopsis acidiphila]GHG86368.1 virulence factor Mce [Amycolatopsis acidiphila]
MIPRFVRVQLLIFAIVSVVSIAVVVVVYAQVPTLLGIGQRTLNVKLTDAAGLYVGSRVTYNGVEIGRVTSVTASPDGANAALSVSSDYRIPSDARANVHSVSAIGEQYIDLAPGSAQQTRFLADGATIPVGRTSVPTPTGTLLDNANSLIASVPPDSLRTSLQELSAAFDGTGPDLQRILDQAGALVGDAQQNFGPTQQLIQDAGPLLNTQTVSSPQIRALVNSLAGFTDTVHADDATIRSLVDRGIPAAQQVDGLFQDLKPTLPILLANLSSVEQVLVTYNPAIEDVLVTYPALTTALISATAPHQDDQSLAIDFRTTALTPPPCTTGFLPADQHRSPDDLSEVSTPDDLYCKLPHDDPTEVRGVRNIPCLDAPGRRAATVQECAGAGFQPTQQKNTAFPAGSPLGNLTSALYDPKTGSGVSADGQLFDLGGIGINGKSKEDLTWQRMLLAPVER